MGFGCAKMNFIYNSRLISFFNSLFIILVVTSVTYIIIKEITGTLKQEIQIEQGTIE